MPQNIHLHPNTLPLWLGLLICSLLYNTAMADPRLCAACRQPITSAYITALGQTWHPEHFTCTICKEKFGSEGFLEREGKPYCTTCYHREFSPRCAACDRPITGRYITALQKTWHAEHFTCTTCGRPLGGLQHAIHEDKPYCTSCYRQQFTPQCAVCLQPVTEEYLKNYWGESFCNHHPDELPTCFSCKRLVSEHLTGGGVRLQDGRSLCNICRQTPVDRVADGMPMVGQVFDALRGMGFDLGGVEIPIRLGDLKDLGVKHGHQTSGRTRTTLHTLGDQVVRREVEEILILSGLPQEHFAAIAAHEYGHAWMFLQEFPPLSPQVEEGLCELFAYLWLSDRDHPQAAHQLHLKQHNEDPVYGAGFRAAVAGLAHYTPSALLEYVRQHRRLPPQNDRH